MNRVCVVGLGYVGLPTASLLATRGMEVRGVDVDPALVAAINRAELPVVEPELDVMVRSAVHSGHLWAFAEPAPAEVFIIAVPTPLGAEHRPDLSHVEAATAALAPHLEPGNLVILESTCPVGTTDRVAAEIRRQRPDLTVPPAERDGAEEPLYIAHCPERVLPGQILSELIHNDRIIGGVDPASTARARTFYEHFVSGRIVATDARTAELCKLTENAYRDVNVAFANELSMVCAELGVNVWEVIELANHHPRVDVLAPGPGVGGHCIAVDPWFLIHSAPDRTRLLRSAREVNLGKTRFVIAQVKAAAERLPHPVIACLGLAYKANVDDLRESPACEVVRQLAADRTGEVLAVEPNVVALPPELAALGVELVALPAALERADLVVALVRHREFLAIEAEVLGEKIVVDACGLVR